jgi:hypothetical protein
MNKEEFDILLKWFNINSTNTVYFSHFIKYLKENKVIIPKEYMKR